MEQATDLLAGGERSGYLLKSRVTDADEFIATLRRIIGGVAVVDPVRNRVDRREARPQHLHEAACPETGDDHRRVLAVVRFLQSR